LVYVSGQNFFSPHLSLEISRPTTSQIIHLFKKA
jgi:hypothetical protein